MFRSLLPVLLITSSGIFFGLENYMPLNVPSCAQEQKDSEKTNEEKTEIVTSSQRLIRTGLLHRTVSSKIFLPQYTAAFYRDLHVPRPSVYLLNRTFRC